MTGEKGWMRIPGIRPHGDRDVAEQMAGLELGLQRAKGKTVLDLGCAEGAIGLEFAKAGAARVLGIESLEGHLAVARKLCEGWPQIEFQQAYLQEWIPAHDPPEVFDVVLALGIIHKIADPAIPLRFACRSCRDLLLFRAPAYAWDGNVKAKHCSIGKAHVTIHVPTIMAEEGFEFERKVDGMHNEAVEYWVRG